MKNALQSCSKLSLALFMLATLGACSGDGNDNSGSQTPSLPAPPPPPAPIPKPVVELPKPGEIITSDQLKAGVCAQQAPSSFYASEIQVVDCNQEHPFEVSGVITVSDTFSGDYPGARALDMDAQKRCRESFETYTGLDYGHVGNSLDVSAITPSPFTWSEGDRNVICLVVKMNNEPLVKPASEY